MPHQATGRPRGRPLGRKSATTVERERVEREVRAAAFADLTEEQILAITPADMFRLVALAAIRAQDLPFILKAAEAWAPYQMPRLAAEVHRVFTDDSKRNTEELQRELADLDRAAEIARKAGAVEERVPEQSHGVVH